MSDELEIQVLKKLIEDVEHRFSPDEVKALKRIAARELAWEAIGLLAKSFKTILTYLGFFIASWVAFKAGIIEWLREAL